MKTDILGRLEKIPLSVEKPLMPLFEAITNSIQAIKEAKQGKNGSITVCIHRESNAPSLKNIKVPPPVIGFSITDNGIGFNEENYNSFDTSDSRHKYNIGGKGVGRFTWLKVFDNVEITSLFKDNGSLKRRVFAFTLGDVEWDGTLQDVDMSVHQQTTVKLFGFKKAYQDHCPKNGATIARKIIEHFLTHFSIVRVPKIVLKDEFDDSVIDLNDEFEKKIKIKVGREQLVIGGHKLSLIHFYLRVGTGDSLHNVHLCVDNRSAEEYPLKRLNRIFEEKLYDDNRPFIYSCCVSGEFFDKRADDSRTKLDLVDNKLDLRSGVEPTRDAILTEICKHAEKNLAEFLTPIKERNFNRVREFIQKNPRYRPLLGARKNWLENIRCGLSDEELNVELFKLSQKLESENLQDGQKLKQSRIDKKTAESLAEHKRKLDKYLEETNAIGFAKLAEYIIHRRAVINFINECKKQLPDGSYEYEKAIHNVVFPMGKTSETIQTADQSNLWLLDDRLSYHYHLASDIQNSQLEKIEVRNDSQDDRMDLVVLQTFDRPHAFVSTSDQPFHSVTIVEFKRPMRDDYVPTNEKKDPILQVWNYANSIRDGYAKDKKGEFIRVSSGTQFYVYLVCDITEKLSALADLYQLQVTPDGLGFFGWHPKYTLYTEIIDYRKLIQDAEKRNKIFFDKFGLPAEN